MINDVLRLAVNRCASCFDPLLKKPVISAFCSPRRRLVLETTIGLARGSSNESLEGEEPIMFIQDGKKTRHKMS